MAGRQDIGIVTFLLYACLLLQLGGVRSQWSLDQLAVDFCNKVAELGHTQCDCVDIVIIPGQGNNLCGYDPTKMPPGTTGLNVVSSTFGGFSGAAPVAQTLTLIQEECDARNTQRNGTLACTSTGSQSLTSETTVSLSVSLEEEISFGIELPGLVEPQVRFLVNFRAEISESQGNTVTASNTCGPGGNGQPAGTCSIYTERYLSYDLEGVGFTYDTIIQGGVWMSFANPIAAPELVAVMGDGSSHYYWYFSFDTIVWVAYGVQLPNFNMFNMPQWEESAWGNPVTFHGAGTLSGQFLDTATTCTISSCS